MEYQIYVIIYNNANYRHWELISVRLSSFSIGGGLEKRFSKWKYQKRNRRNTRFLGRRAHDSTVYLNQGLGEVRIYAILT